MDVLVFAGTGDVLEANPDVGSVIEITERPTVAQHVALLTRIRRRYDLALSLAPGDRPSLYAWIAGRQRVGLLLGGRKHRWKRALMTGWAPFDNLNTHTVLMHLALADLLGIDRAYEVIVNWKSEHAAQVDALLECADSPLAVLHTFPKFNYKMWRTEGWIEAARWLTARGYRIALTGGNEQSELAYIAEVTRLMPRNVVNLAGRLSLCAAANLVSRARVYVGLDTAMTHIAAALGVPTVALYGPSNPVKWGPWPRGHASDANPWRRCGSQRVGNVTLLQGTQGCVPCMVEGCERHIASFSDCLQQMPAARVIVAIENALADAPLI